MPHDHVQKIKFLTPLQGVKISIIQLYIVTIPVLIFTSNCFNLLIYNQNLYLKASQFNLHVHNLSQVTQQSLQAN